MADNIHSRLSRYNPRQAVIDAITGEDVRQVDYDAAESIYLQDIKGKFTDLGDEQDFILRLIRTDIEGGGHVPDFLIRELSEVCYKGDISNTQSYFEHLVKIRNWFEQEEPEKTFKWYTQEVDRRLAWREEETAKDDSELRGRALGDREVFLMDLRAYVKDSIGGAIFESAVRHQFYGDGRYLEKGKELYHIIKDPDNGLGIEPGFQETMFFMHLNSAYSTTGLPEFWRQKLNEQRELLESDPEFKKFQKRQRAAEASQANIKPEPRPSSTVETADSPTAPNF